MDLILRGGRRLVSAMEHNTEFGSSVQGHHSCSWPPIKMMIVTSNNQQKNDKKNIGDTNIGREGMEWGNVVWNKSASYWPTEPKWICS